jgi:predicted kinase
MKPLELVDHIAESSSPHFVLMCGPPCSGKSTYSNVLRLSIKAPFSYISPDSFLYSKQGLYVWNPTLAAHAHKTSHQLLRDAVTRKHHVVYDATNTKQTDRNKLLKIVSDNDTDSVYQKVLVLMPQLSAEDLEARNQTRTPDRQIPQEVMERMQKAFANTQISLRNWDLIMTAPRFIV